MTLKTPTRRPRAPKPVPLSVPLLNRGTAEPAKQTEEPSEPPVGAESAQSVQGVTQGALVDVVPLSVPLFLVPEAANLTGLTPRAIRKAIVDGRLQAEEKSIEDGHHKGRSAYQIPSAALFALYPAARARFEARAEAEARLALRESQAQAAKAAAPVPNNDTADLKDWQRVRMDARLGLLRYRDQLRAERDCSKNMAISLVVAHYTEGTLPEPLAQLAREASARGQHISTRTLERWDQQIQAGLVGLAPKAAYRAEPKWIHPLLAIWRRPQKPSLASALEDLPGELAPGVPMPSYDQAWRYLKKIGEVEKQRGRLLDRELKTVQPFKRRERPEFPLDAWLADGHTFDAEVQHPVHGQAFRPEITAIVDLATNRLVGWSVGLAEGALVVVDALRTGILAHGVPAIFYSDNGPGYVNQTMAALTLRLGISHTTSIPHRSQSRGVIERLNKTLYVEMAAKRLSTYIGKDMDRQAKQIAYVATRKDQGKLLPWDTFVAFIEAVTEAYNNKPTSALPKLTDETGKKRHLSPNEAWQKAMDSGWAPEALVSDLHEFMPTLVRTTRRGEVNLFGNRYYSRALAEHHGLEIQVAYDIHDAAKVWCRDLDGNFITLAEFEANKTAYFPQSFVEQARSKREQGRLGRLQRQVEEIRAEAGPKRIKEITPQDELRAQEAYATLGMTPPPNQARNVADGTAPEAAPVLEPAASTRPDFHNQIDYVKWALEHKDQCDAAELADVQHQIENSLPIRLALGIPA